MSWHDEPATSAQLTTIRDLYIHALGWNRAMGKVHELKASGFTKGMASQEITRLRSLKDQGRLIEENI